MAEIHALSSSRLCAVLPYLARRLAKITGLPLHPLDKLFWKPDWGKPSPEEWAATQQSLVAGERWIIDGNHQSTMPIRFAAADLIIFPDVSRLVCIGSACRRLGQKREDFPEYLEQKFNRNFLDLLRWIWNYPKNAKPQMLALAAKYPQTPLLVLKGRSGMRRFLAEQENGL